MPKRNVTLLLVILVLSFSAQEIRFEKFGVRQGLLSDEAYNLHQDEKGYLWVFSNYGTLKYNSVSFKHVLRNLPFSESFIYCCYERDGRMWVANSKGRIFTIRNDSAFQVAGTEDLAETLRKAVMEIYQLYVDDSLNIYAITKHNSYRFNRREDYQNVNLSEPKHDSVTHRFIVKPDGVFPVYYFNGNDSVYCGGFSKLNLQVCNETKCSPAFSIPCRSSGIKHVKKYGQDIYFSHHATIGKINGNSLSFIQVGNVIHNFTRDRNGHLWVGCYNGGLYELNEKDSVINHYLGNTTVNDVLVDFQDGLWVSTTGYGLYHCKSMKFKFFTESSALGKSINFIRNINGDIYIGTGTGALYRLHENNYEFILSKNSDSDPLDIARNDRTIFLASRYMLESFTEKNGKFTNQRLISNSLFAKRLIPLDGDTLLCLKRKSLSWMIGKKNVRSVQLTSKTYDAKRYKGTVFVAMENGVWEVIGNKLTQPTYLEPTNRFAINSIQRDASGNLWFCSIGGGLFRLSEDNHLTRLTTFDGMPANIVNDICFSEKEGVLLSTNKGLFFASNFETTPGNWFRLFNENTRQALFYKGKIIAATNNGLVVQELINNEGTKIHFNFNSVLVNDQTISLEGLRNLNYRQNSVEFKFDVISYNDDKLSLWYKLQGPTQDSGSTSYAEIKFQKLPPGDYTLTVSPGASTNAVLISIPFTIKPALWQTSWFTVIVYLFIIIILLLLTRAFIRQYKKKEVKRHEANRLVLEYRLIALKAQINPHFMSNCLTAIQHLIINNKLEEATAYIAKFGLLVRQILNFSTRLYISLHEELVIATLNMELEQLRFERKFQFMVEVDEEIDPREIQVPALLLNPIIENAIWHGLMPLAHDKEGLIVIRARLNNGTIEISIEDNGVGWQNTDQQIGNTKESKGLELTRQRLSNINYLYQSTVAGLVFTRREGGGTCATITLPLNITRKTDE